MSRDEILSAVKDILARYNVQEAYLFGSYARGDYNKFSDIDLAISCEDLDDYFEIVERLDEIDTMRKFDVHNLCYTSFSFNVEEVKKDAVKLC